MTPRARARRARSSASHKVAAGGLFKHHMQASLDRGARSHVPTDGGCAQRDRIDARSVPDHRFHAGVRGDAVQRGVATGGCGKHKARIDAERGHMLVPRDLADSHEAKANRGGTARPAHLLFPRGIVRHIGLPIGAGGV